MAAIEEHLTAELPSLHRCNRDSPNVDTAKGNKLWFERPKILVGTALQGEWMATLPRFKGKVDILSMPDPNGEMFGPCTADVFWWMQLLQCDVTFWATGQFWTMEFLEAVRWPTGPVRDAGLRIARWAWTVPGDIGADQGIEIMWRGVAHSKTGRIYDVGQSAKVG